MTTWHMHACTNFTCYRSLCLLQSTHTCHGIVDNSRFHNPVRISTASWRPRRTLRLSPPHHSFSRPLCGCHTHKLSRRGRGYHPRHDPAIAHTNAHLITQHTLLRLVRTSTSRIPRRLIEDTSGVRDRNCTQECALPILDNFELRGPVPA